MTTKALQTPWGEAQSVNTLGEGVAFCSTASHGGYLLDADHAAAARKLFPHFHADKGTPSPAAVGVFYEEDCEWLIVALAFPDLFPDSMLADAVDTARSVAKWERQDRGGDKYSSVAAWIDGGSDRAEAILKRAAAHAKAVEGLWRRGGLSSHASRPDLWTVHFYRAGDSRSLEMPYPMKMYYSDEELTSVISKVELAKESK